MAVMTTQDVLTQHVFQLNPERRVLCAVAGAPGSGKSTLAGNLVEALNTWQPGTADMLQMDGFHYDDTYLEPAGLKPRKGAPNTFDVNGLRYILSRLKENSEDAIAVPSFDRSLELSRAGAKLIPQSARIVIVEGNYLLLQDSPWNVLRPFFDVSVMIYVPEATLRKRLSTRWIKLGLPPHEVARKVEENDLPNGLLVQARSNLSDFVITRE